LSIDSTSTRGDGGQYAAPGACGMAIDVGYARAKKVYRCIIQAICIVASRGWGYFGNGWIALRCVIFTTEQRITE